MRGLFTIILWMAIGAALVSWLGGEPDRAETVSEVAAPLPAPEAAVDPDKAREIETLAKPAGLAAAAPPRPTTDKSIGRRMFVSGSRVNVRAGPGIGNGIVGTLPKGTPLTVLGEDGGWSEVTGSFGGRTLSGWMSSQFLAAQKPPAPAPAAVARSRTVAPPSTAEIARARKEIIRQSIAAYPGSCPCPFNRDRAGHRCGGRSAWSRRGGYAPLCYDSDVSEARLATYFARRRPAQ